MCGICGVVSLSGREIPVDIIEKVVHIFWMSHDRGEDAWGYLLYGKNLSDKKTIRVHKEKGSVLDGLTLNKIEKICNKNIQLFMCHTRKETKGSSSDMNNIHPVIVDKKYFITHNGSVSTDDKEINDKKKFEVDSEIIGIAAKSNKLDLISGTAVFSIYDHTKKCFSLYSNKDDLFFTVVDGEFLIYFQDRKYDTALYPKKYELFHSDRMTKVSNMQNNILWTIFLTEPTRTDTKNLEIKKLKTYSSYKYTGHYCSDGDHWDYGSGYTWKRSANGIWEKEENNNSYPEKKTRIMVL